MINNAFFVDTLLRTHLKWWVAYPLGAVIWIVLALFAVIVMGFVEKFPALEQRTCKEGGKAPFSFGPETPFVLSIIAAWFAAFKVAVELRKLRGAIHYGIDFSNLGECSFPFLGPVQLPVELTLALGVFAKYWYVPVTLCIVSTLLRIKVFRSFRSGIRYLAVQLLNANVVYWLYGIVVAFALMPAVAGLYSWIMRSELVPIAKWLFHALPYILGIALMLVLLLIKAAFFIMVGILPFFISKIFGRIESELFYRNPESRTGFCWLPIIGSAIVGMVAAIPVGWSNFWAKSGEKLVFWGGEKIAWTAPCFGWTFQVPNGVADVYGRVLWGIPALLAFGAFVFRIWCFRSIFRAICQLLFFTIVAYVTTAFFSVYYADVVVPAVICFALFVADLALVKDGFASYFSHGDTIVDEDGKVYKREFGKENVYKGEDGQTYSVKGQ